MSSTKNSKDNTTAATTTPGRYSYFYNKKIKQAEQDIQFRKQYETIGKQTSQLLKGLTIYVNGHTIPGRLQIHDMVVLNGGRFLHHLSSKGSATHIIASSLPPKKRIEFKNYKVINPQWLVDCIKQQKIVPWQEYSILKSNIEQPSILKTSSVVTTPGNKTGPPDCNDPNFLVDYFKHSRLHHLSEWKASLRQKFVESYRDIQPLTHSDSSYTILHIDFDCFFATVAYLFRDKRKTPTLDFDKDPIAVCHGVKNSDIASCNYAARKFGLKNGMWVGTAEKMLPNDIKLTTLPYDFEHIEKGSKVFYSVLQGIEQFYCVLPVSIDEAICVMAKDAMENKQTLLQLCNALRQRIKHETSGCVVSVGVSDSLVLARLALRTAKPNGVFLFDNNSESQDSTDVNQFWSSFKLDDLPGVGRSTLKKIRDKYPKVKTLHDLRQSCQNVASLQSVLGNKLGEKVCLALRGKDDDESARIIYDPINVFQRKSISIDINWGIRFKDMVEIDRFLDVCSDYLVNQKLAEYNKLTSSITLKLMQRCVDAPIDPPKYMGMGRCDPFTTSSRLGVPTNDDGIIATELKHMFRTLPVPPVELRGVSIQFNRLVDANDAVDPNAKVGLSLLFQSGHASSTAITTTTPPTRSIESPHDRGESTDPHRRYKRLKRSPVKERQDQLESNQRQAYQQQFFQELPTQIRKDVQHELEITRKVKGSKLQRMKEKLQKRENAIQNMNSHFMNNDSIFVPIKFQKETNFEKICSMVNDWVRETIKEKGPHERDLQFFKKYLNKLCDSDRVHLVLRLADMVSVTLNLMSHKYGDREGFLEWEMILLKFIVPLMNRNRHTFQTERKLDIEYDI